MERAIRDNINPRFFSLIPIASIPIIRMGIISDDNSSK